MARRGRSEDEEESGPVRSCAVTRERRPLEELIRFVLSPDGVATPDLRRRLPGRGVSITGRRDAIETAVRKNVFARGLKAQAKAPADLAGQVDALLARDALQALSLANKAGAVTAGFAKVEAAIAAGGLAGLLRAHDGGGDGARKLAAALRRTGAEALPVVDLFASAELDLALGRSNVIHAALAAGGAAENFLARCRRLSFYRADNRTDGAVQARMDDGAPENGSCDAGDATDGPGPRIENE
ncbi:MAG: RNA-binding protein [Rhizobiales bacterium]|nr:RNA-binding protein [Hyphomicrobiales bacterium]